MTETSRRAFVIQHVNTSEFLSRYNGHWGRSSDLGAASLFATQAEADIALQALMQEAEDRVAQSKDIWPSSMWWELKGGLTVVTEVEIITRTVVGGLTERP